MTQRMYGLVLGRNRTWYNFAHETEGFRCMTGCLTPNSAEACSAYEAGDEIVVFDVTEMGRYAPEWFSQLPQLEFKVVKATEQAVEDA